MTNKNMITIYGKQDCKWCDAAKDLLQRRSIEYTYVDIINGMDSTTRDLLLTVIAPEAKTVPIIIINGVWIGGYAELEKRSFE